jgi:hypothetical protein
MMTEPRFSPNVARRWPRAATTRLSRPIVVMKAGIFASIRHFP